MIYKVFDKRSELSVARAICRRNCCDLVIPRVQSTDSSPPRSHIHRYTPAVFMGTLTDYLVPGIVSVQSEQFIGAQLSNDHQAAI